MQENTFYWVQYHDDELEVVLFANGEFWLTGSDVPADPAHLVFISKIERPSLS